MMCVHLCDWLMMDATYLRMLHTWSVCALVQARHYGWQKCTDNTLTIGPLKPSCDPLSRTALILAEYKSHSFPLSKSVSPCFAPQPLRPAPQPVSHYHHFSPLPTKAGQPTSISGIRYWYSRRHLSYPHGSRKGEQNLDGEPCQYSLRAFFKRTPYPRHYSYFCLHRDIWAANCVGSGDKGQ